MAAEHSPSSRPENPSPADVLTSLSAECFQDWYRERQYRRNIENGTPYFNGPSRVPEPERHSPSSLLQCHRKTLYRQRNAPAEESDPHGIFWFGTQFEEDLVFPFLERAVTGPNTYVRNTMWIDTTVETEAGELRIKGATDPVIVDEDSVPILPTEVKTKSSLDHIDAPSQHHRAQAHAYLFGLSKKYDIELTDAAILYGSRQSLEVEVFHVEFDEAFWEDIVLEWASKHTQYRLDNELPSAIPEYDWECDFCSYRERCGMGERHATDCGSTGLLTRYSGYPREKLVEYLDSHPDAELTPSLAFDHRDLADEYGVYDWECTRCRGTYAWDSVEWNGDVTQPPRCPACFETNSISLLRGPEPDNQVGRRSAHVTE